MTETHIHVFGKWFPYDRNHKWRGCVVPGCLYFEKVKVTA